MRFEAGENEAGRRLDRVLKKILRGAPLSFVYRIIRKDVKVNGRRVSAETLLAAGDVIEIFIPEEQIQPFTQKKRTAGSGAKRQFGIIFEDENILVVNKPYGLLTHGDASEKKNTLANQVIAYMIQNGVYIPGQEKIFTPAPANRLDRNTTGIVLFGKTLPATRDLAKMLHGVENENPFTDKIYLTIVKGIVKDPLRLSARMVRDGERNVTKVLPQTSQEGRIMVTEVRPLAEGKGFTLVEARLLTGRTHQIRAQLAAEGFPVIGDRKYGDRIANQMTAQKYGLTTQLLHAYKLGIEEGAGSLTYLQGKHFKAEPPARFAEIAEDLGCYMKAK